MGRLKRRLETVSFVSESLSTHESQVDSSPNQHNAMDGGEPSVMSGASPLRANNDKEGPTKKRGKTVMDGVWKLAANKRIVVECNHLWLPVGNGGKCLASFLGVIVRLHCPLNYKDWHQVPVGTKHHIISLIENKFSYPPEMSKWLKRSMSAKWRYYKADLKARYFYPNESLEFNLRKCPEDVHDDQWEFLVSYWRTDIVKKISAKNKENRGNEVISHTTGRLSFACKISEHNKEHDTTVGMIEGFYITHVRQDGTYLNQRVVEILENAKAKKVERLKTKSVDPYMGELEILIEAVESNNSRRLPGVGSGVTKADVFGRKASTLLTNHTNEEFDNLKKELAEQKELTAKEQQLRIAQGEMIQNLQEQMAEMHRMMQLKSSSRSHRTTGKRPLQSSTSNNKSRSDINP